MRTVFNKMSGITPQPIKDVINGFDHTNGWGLLHMVGTALMSLQVSQQLSMGYISPISLLFTGAAFVFAHQKGKQERQAGYTPRYIP